MKKYAIIVAGGKGTRMRSELPKQFLLLDGKPIIAHTIEKFLNVDAEVVLVLPKDHFSHWSGLQEMYFPGKSILTSIGGDTRTASVRSGLEKIDDLDGLVAVHDAVRPFVSAQIIDDSYQSAAEYGSGVAAVLLKDSIRELTGGHSSVARDRANYMTIQTPQTFRLKELRQAYSEVQGFSHSDDATVFELAGFQVRLIQGDYANIKITTPDDLNIKCRNCPQ